MAYWGVQEGRLVLIGKIWRDIIRTIFESRLSNILLILIIFIVGRGASIYIQEEFIIVFKLFAERSLELS